MENEKKELIDQKENKRKYDPEFKGPIQHRSCTDVVCCIIFCAYMIGMVVVAAIGFYEGQPKRLLYPTDSDGKVCGIDVLDKQYLYFFDLTKCLTKGASDPLEYVKKGFSCPTPQVCVSECPKKTSSYLTLDKKDMVCTRTAKMDLSKQELVKDGSCAPYLIKSKPMLRRCIPDEMAKIFDKLGMHSKDGKNITFNEISAGQKALTMLMNIQSTGIKIARELGQVWYWILAAFIITMIVTVIYIIIARWITFPLVVFTGIGVLVLLVFGTYHSFKTYFYLKNSGSSKDITSLTDFSSYSQNQNCWLVLGIILAALLLILLLIMVFMMSKLRLACGLIAEASRAVSTMLSALFFPLIPWLLQIVWFAWFAVILAFLFSNGTKQYRVDQNDTRYNLSIEQVCNPDMFTTRYPGTNSSCLFADYAENKNLMYMQIFHLAGWLWGANFIIAFSECSLAGAFASYYFAFNKPHDIPAMPVFQAMWRSLSYHCGSLALGAAIITIVQLIRLLLEYVHKKLKETTDNPVADFIMKCLKCCFWCLEKCLRFINKNAYIIIAIYGKNFCASAKDAVFLLARNIVSTAAINSVTGFILLLGKLLVTGGIGVASFYWFTTPNPLKPDELEFSIAPVVVCTIAAYLVTSLFFSVYDMGIDTLFLCYLEDIERNDGTPERPYYMTPTLQEVVHHKNQSVGDGQGDNAL